MDPEKTRDRKSAVQREREESSHADRGPGHTVQRRMPQQQMESAGSASPFAHGEDSSFDSHLHPPQHDRAG